MRKLIVPVDNTRYAAGGKVVGHFKVVQANGYQNGAAGHQKKIAQLSVHMKAPSSKQDFVSSPLDNSIKKTDR